MRGENFYFFSKEFTSKSLDIPALWSTLSLNGESDVIIGRIWLVRIQFWSFNCAASACTVTAHVASSSLAAMLDLEFMSFEFQGKAFPNAFLFVLRGNNGFLGSVVVKSSSFMAASFTTCEAGHCFSLIESSVRACSYSKRCTVLCWCWCRCEASGSMSLHLGQPRGGKSPLIILREDDWLAITDSFFSVIKSCFKTNNL